MNDFKYLPGDTLYLKLYNILKKDIESNKISHKLPSIRKTAKNFNLSIFTVIKAYELLEKAGYVSSKKGSGFFIKDNRNQPLFYEEDHMASEDFKYNYFNENCKIDFSLASPKSDFFPIELLKESINKILDIEGEKALLYEIPQGNIQFRKTIANNLKNYNIFTKLDNIQIISGAQQGINIVSQILIQNGDIVVLENPTYKGAVNSFINNGASIKKISIENDGINLSELESFLKFNKIRLLYIIPIFQNPTGITMSEKKKLKLLKLAEKYDFYIIEDDSLSDIYFNKQFFPLKSLDINNRVIYIKSYSKIFMPGFRLGFMITPSWLINDIVRTKYSSDISTSGLNQRIFQYFLEENIWEKYIQKLRNHFKEKQEFLHRKLSKIDKILFIKPLGGLSFWIKLPNNITGEAIYFKLLNHGVKIIPGVVFSSDFSNYIRLSFAQCSIQDIDTGINILKKAIDELDAL